MIGVTIEKGPSHYQILQQKSGYAEIDLEGTVEISENVIKQKPCVLIHLLDENSGTLMIPPVSTEIIDGRWKAKLKAPLGGLYTIRTFVRYGVRDVLRGDIITHIGVGDLYLIAGQSNAAGNGKNSMSDPLCDMVHMLKFNNTWDVATHPLNDGTGTKYSRYNEVAYHSPWLQFAKILYRHLGYPIGLIPSAQGGLPLSFWDKDENGELFDDMMEIVKTAGGCVRGILWYQGCSDADTQKNRDTYFERFRKVCEDIRNSIGSKIPFLTIQLNKTTYWGWPIRVENILRNMLLN